MTLSQRSRSDWLHATAFASFCLLSVNPARKAALHYRALELDCVSLSVPTLKHCEWWLDMMSGERDEKINEDDMWTLNSKQTHTWRALYNPPNVIL